MQGSPNAHSLAAARYDKGRALAAAGCLFEDEQSICTNRLHRAQNWRKPSSTPRLNCGRRRSAVAAKFLITPHSNIPSSATSPISVPAAGRRCADWPVLRDRSPSAHRRAKPSARPPVATSIYLLPRILHGGRATRPCLLPTAAGRPRPDRKRCLDRSCGDRDAGSQSRRRGRSGGRRRGHPRCRALHHRRRRAGATDPGALQSRNRGSAVADRVVGLACRNHLATPAGISVRRCRRLLRALGFLSNKHGAP